MDVKDVIELRIATNSNVEQGIFYILYKNNNEIILVKSNFQIYVLDTSITSIVELRTYLKYKSLSKLSYQTIQSKIHFELRNLYDFRSLVSKTIDFDLEDFINTFKNLYKETTISNFNKGINTFINDVVFNCNFLPNKNDLIKGEDINGDIINILVYDILIYNNCTYIVSKDGSKIKLGYVMELLLSGKNMKDIKYKEGVFVQAKPNKKEGVKKYYGIYLEKLSIHELISKNKDLNFKIPILIREQDIKKVINFNIKEISINSNFKALIKLCRFKIKDSKESSNLFGLKKIKESQIGNFVEIIEFLENFECKKDKQIRDILLVRLENGREVKFVKNDIEIIYPNLNFIPKLDRSIKINSVVICKKPATPKLKKDNFYFIKSIKANKSNSNLNILTLIDLKTDEIIRSYQKNFKVTIECLKKQEELNKEYLEVEDLKTTQLYTQNGIEQIINTIESTSF